MANAPTLVSYTDVSWTTTDTSKATSTINWNANDLLVVISGCEGPGALTTPTGTGLSFSNIRTNTTGSTCGTILAVAQPTAAGSSAVTMTNSALQWGFAVWVFRNHGSRGNSGEQHTTTKTVNVTPWQGNTNSAFVWGVFDFSANPALTLTPTATNTRQAAATTGYSYYAGDLTAQTSSGAVGYGLAAGSGTGPFSILVLEISGQGRLPSVSLRPAAFKPGLAR